MRSCIYCGRELGDGEKCGCRGAAARRAAKEKQTEDNTQNSGGYYRTGYTKPESRIKRAWNRFTAKREVRKNKRKTTVNKGSVRNSFAYIWRFIKSPAEEILNPKAYTMPQMILISAIEGAIIALAMFFAFTGTRRGIFITLARLMGLGGAAGYKSLLMVLYAVLSGAAGGIILFVVYSGVFWLVNKLMFRTYLPFKAMAQRLILTPVPFAALSAVGCVLSVLSGTTLMILMLCGSVSTLVLTYIALGDEWSSHSRSRIMYAMMLGYFIFLTFVGVLIQAAVI